MKQVPVISQTTFWDVEISEIDWEENSEWVIHRVFDRGTLQEVRRIVKYYGKDFVINSLVKYPYYVPFHTIVLAMGIFQLKYTDFECCKNKPFPPTYWSLPKP